MKKTISIAIIAIICVAIVAGCFIINAPSSILISIDLTAKITDGKKYLVQTVSINNITNKDIIVYGNVSNEENFRIIDVTGYNGDGEMYIPAHSEFKKEYLYPFSNKTNEEMLSIYLRDYDFRIYRYSLNGFLINDENISQSYSKKHIGKSKVNCTFG